MAAMIKKNVAPESVVGEEGTAKRNILRKGPPAAARKGGAPSGSGKVDDGSCYADPASLDRNDPNYDSEAEADKGFVPDAFHQMRESVRSSKLTLTTYKKAVTPLVIEFFSSGDVDDMLRNVQEVGAPEYAYECVKRAINMSLDKTDRERELVSQLLSIGYPDTFSANMIGKGFERLFEIVDEVELDVPAARDMLAKVRRALSWVILVVVLLPSSQCCCPPLMLLVSTSLPTAFTQFVARAVVDEVLPPSFLSDAVVCNLGGEIVEHAKRMLSREHGGGLLDGCWGPGDGRPVADMKVALDQVGIEDNSHSFPDPLSSRLHTTR